MGVGGMRGVGWGGEEYSKAPEGEGGGGRAPVAGGAPGEGLGWGGFGGVGWEGWAGLGRDIAMERVQRERRGSHS